MKIFQGLYTCFAIIGSGSSAFRGTKFLQHKKHLVRYYSTNDDYITSGAKNIELLSSNQELSPVIDKSLVSRLINKQFPKFKDYPINPILPGGWDNRVFRLGEDMLIRMPSAKKYEVQVEKEQQWLPKLAPLLPLPIPEPLEIGKPGEGYPWKWSIYRWLKGEMAASAEITDFNGFATDLAQFLIALQKINTIGGPIPKPHNFAHISGLATYDIQTKQAIYALKDKIDANVATKIWEEALDTTWHYPPVWVHGDITAGNLLVNKGKLSAVIDFGGLGVGDPACDLVIAWKFFGERSRETFHEMLPLDEGTWSRGRAWALWKSLIIAAGFIESNSIETSQTWYTINEVLKDYKYSNIASSSQRKSDIEDVEKDLIYKEQVLKTTQDLYKYSHTAVAAELFNVGFAYNNIGDQAKGTEYIKQAYVMYSKVLGKNHPDSKKLEKFLSSASPSFFEIDENREIIKQRGELDNLTVKIKYQLQRNILNKINDLAAKGVWNKSMISSCEIREKDWGVNDYINESYLYKKLGKLAKEEEAMEIAKMLCFEAICLGIMKSSAKNLTCVIKFAEKYPELIKKIVSIHPEYFIDGSILKSLVRDLELIDKLLANNPEGMGFQEYEQDNYWYKYSKRAIEEILELRLKSANAYDVNKVKIITLSESWYNSMGILEEIAQAVRFCKESKILIPLNIYNKHWVGMAIDIYSSTIKINYMDPEQNVVPAMLKDKLMGIIAKKCPKHYIEFRETKLEKQMFNNCGPEVIENFVNHLTGHRLSQDITVQVHSALLEDTLLSGLASDVSTITDTWT